jgi:hypothetical protein
MNTVQKIIPTHEADPAKEQLWKEHARRQKESGLSRIAYCRKHQLSYTKFGYWERKWRQETTGSKLVPIHLNEPTKIVSETICTLSLKNGHELKIHDKTILPMLLSLWG